MNLAIAGSFSFDAALEFVIKRASVLRPDLLRPAGMAAIGANASTVNSYIDSLSMRDRLTIAVFNAESSVVVSGALDAIDTIVAAVKQEGLKATRLDVNQGRVPVAYLHPPTLTACSIPQPLRCSCDARPAKVVAGPCSGCASSQNPLLL